MQEKNRNYKDTNVLNVSGCVPPNFVFCLRENILSGGFDISEATPVQHIDYHFIRVVLALEAVQSIQILSVVGWVVVVSVSSQHWKSRILRDTQVLRIQFS